MPEPVSLARLCQKEMGKVKIDPSRGSAHRSRPKRWLGSYRVLGPVSVRSCQKEIGKVTIDPSGGLEAGDCGSPADDHGGRLGHGKFAGICDSLRGAAAGGPSDGNDHGNSGGHDHSSNRCRKRPHSHRQHKIAAEKHARYVFPSSAPNRGLDKRAAIMRR